MCGIIGIISNNQAAPEIYDGLLGLQHRGQDACGICTYNGQFHLKKGIGLVRDVFRENDMLRLQGNIGIGHTRYVTVGGMNYEDTQPFYVESPYGITLAHNGNLYNFSELKEELMRKDLRHVNSNCDAEVILNILGDGLRRNNHSDFVKTVFKAVDGIYKRAKGAYSVVSIISDKGLLAFRDPYGIRPLIMGKREKEFQTEYIFTSENTMFNALGFDYIRDVEPGEAIFINHKREIYNKIIKQKDRRPCIFEYVYFARPDSMLDRISVYRSRLRMGQNLAKKIKKLHPQIKVDVVIPAPSTANTAALSCAHQLGVRYTEGLVKNQFIGRTFIMPGQEIRKKSVKQKLSPIELEIKDKNVLIVDDSIVRGNTSQQIISLVRDFGAKEVYFAATAPPLRSPCFYGIDMPSRNEFIANNLTEEEIKKSIGADILVYQDLEDLIEAVTRKGDHKIKKLCTACFNGDYPTGDVDEKVFKKMEEERSADKARAKELENEKMMF